MCVCGVMWNWKSLLILRNNNKIFKIPTVRDRINNINRLNREEMKHLNIKIDEEININCHLKRVISDLNNTIKQLKGNNMAFTLTDYMNLCTETNSLKRIVEELSEKLRIKDSKINNLQEEVLNKNILLKDQYENLNKIRRLQDEIRRFNNLDAENTQVIQQLKNEIINLKISLHISQSKNMCSDLSNNNNSLGRIKIPNIITKTGESIPVNSLSSDEFIRLRTVELTIEYYKDNKSFTTITNVKDFARELENHIRGNK